MAIVAILFGLLRFGVLDFVIRDYILNHQLGQFTTYTTQNRRKVFSVCRG